MAEVLLRLLTKAGQQIPNPFGSERQYVKPRLGDGAGDSRTLIGDMSKIGGDLRKVAKRELAKASSAK